jgi:diguanylate cyclase (GGDEF)-like protein/PAS domain S-box-containing protein
MNAPLRILHLEDNDHDAKLVRETLAREDIAAEFVRVQGKNAFVAALDDQALVLILSGYGLPNFDGVSALAIAHRKRPDLPFILVADALEENVAIEALKSGATDYVFKSNLKRLGPVVRRALDEARSHKERQHYEQALHARESEMRIITDNIPALVAYYDENLVCRYANKPYAEFFGSGSQDIVGKRLAEIVGVRNYRDIKDQFTRVLLGTPVTYQRAHQFDNDDIRHIEVRLIPDTTEEGKIRGCYDLCDDITESLHADAALKESERQFRQLTNNIPEVFRISSADQRKLFYVSPAYEKIWGRPVEELMANPSLWFDAVHPDDRDRTKLAAERAAEEAYDEEYRIVRPDGSVRWVHEKAFPVSGESGRVDRIAGTAEDVTERKHIESRLLHLTHHDPLTDLPNRVLLNDRLVQALAQAKRNGWIAAAMFLGLDHFKMINETLGHGAGDELVREVSGRIVNAVRLADTVGRFGGDEFVVILSHLHDIEDASLVAKKILDSLAQPLMLGNQEVFVTVSIGISLFPSDSDEPAALLRNADAAMYRAKDMGRNNFQFYTAEMNARTHQRLRLESSLRRAIERHEFVLYYQPKAGIRTGEITGVEALIRWNHPERGIVTPSEFIPLLEDTGLIVAVGEWVLQSACAQARQWQDAGLGPIRIAVNSSAREFQQRDFGAVLARIAREAGIDPALIEVEITESLLMKDPAGTAAMLQQIREMGVRITIDDFGTGYSSLSYLTRFPLSAVKIDRSFVTNITNDTGSASIARAVINLAHILGMKVIAEGVETEGQLGFLRANGCDELQGYLLSKPIDAEACTRLLSSGCGLQIPAEERGPAKHNLLLVDDDANILSALTRLLQRDGYRILTAGNANEALELLAINSIGVVISDQRMPGVSGVEFLSRVRNLHPATMRMVLSGYADLKAVIEAINSGAVYKFLTKPWDSDQLRASVSEAFQIYDLRKARAADSATPSDAGS